MSKVGPDPIAERNMQALKKKSFEVNFELTGTPYKAIENIGIGAYGVVCSATHTKTGEKVAIKKIPGIFGHPTIAKRTYREIKILKHFKHDNIIGIREILKPTGPVEKLKDVYIVFDLMESDLHRIIHSKQDLTDEHIRYFLYQLLRGLKYIHSSNVIHRDLKPGNLLVNENCDLKIGDFGMARGLASAGKQPTQQNEMMMTQYVATRWYRAPELIVPTTEDYTGAVDMWSVGCIFAEMLGKWQIFRGKHQREQLTLMVGILGSPAPTFLKKLTSDQYSHFFTALGPKEPVALQRLYPKASQKALNLLAKMLVIDPAERVSVESALCDLYLSKYHDAEDEPICIPAFDFSFEKQSMDNDQLKRAIIKEIMDFHKRAPPKLVFDFRPVPKEELLQTVKSPGGTSHTMVGVSGVEAFLRQADKRKCQIEAANHISQPLEIKPYTGPGTFTPVRKEFKSPLAVKTENLKEDKSSIQSGNDIEMLSAKSTTDNQSSKELSIKMEDKKEGSVIDVDMLSAKSRDPQSIENEAPRMVEPVSVSQVTQADALPETRPMDAKERLKAALLNQGLRRQMQAKDGDKKRPVTAAQRQKEREEARKKKKESARQRAKKKKNSPKTIMLTEEDRGLLQRWQGMMGKTAGTAGSLSEQNAGAVYTSTQLNVPQNTTLPRNPSPSRTVLQPGGMIQQITTMGGSSTMSGVIQDNVGVQITSVNVSAASVQPQMAFTSVSSSVISSHQGVPPGQADPQINEQTVYAQNQGISVEAPSGSFQQGAPLFGTNLTSQVASGGSSVDTSPNPQGAALTGTPFMLGATNPQPFTQDQLVFGVSVPRNTSNISLEDESSNDSGLNVGVGDTSPDFVDKLLAGSEVPLGEKLPGSVSVLKPLNIPESTSWAEGTSQTRLPSYTEAVQARHGDFVLSPDTTTLIGGAHLQPSTITNVQTANPSVPVTRVGSTMSNTFPLFSVESTPGDASDYNRQPTTHPFQSYQGDQNQASSENSSKVQAPSDLLLVITRLKQHHVEDLTLAQTPKGTGHGYGVGGEEGGMDVFSSILGDVRSEEKLDSAPPSASLLADWMEMTKNINLDNMELDVLELGNLNSPPCD